MIVDSRHEQTVELNRHRIEAAQADSFTGHAEAGPSESGPVSLGKWLEVQMLDHPAATLIVAATIGILAGYWIKWRR